MCEGSVYPWISHQFITGPFMSICGFNTLLKGSNESQLNQSLLSGSKLHLHMGHMFLNDHYCACVRGDYSTCACI